MLGIELDSNANFREVSISACSGSSVEAEAISVPNELPNENNAKDLVLIETELDDTRNVSYSTAISEQTDDGEPNGLISAIPKNFVIDLTESPLSNIKTKAKLDSTFSPPKKIDTIVDHDGSFTEKTSTEQLRVPVNNLTFSPIPNENNSQTNIMPNLKYVIDDQVAGPSGVRNVGCKKTAVPSKIVPFHFGNSKSVVGHTKAFSFKMQSTSTPLPVFNKVKKG